MVSASKITLAASQAHWTSFLSHACCLPALCEIGFSREDTSGLRRVRAEAVMSPRLGLGLWSHQAAAGGGMGAPLPAAIWGQYEPGPSPALTLPSIHTHAWEHCSVSNPRGLILYTQSLSLGTARGSSRPGTWIWIPSSLETAETLATSSAKRWLQRATLGGCGLRDAHAEPSLQRARERSPAKGSWSGAGNQGTQ